MTNPINPFNENKNKEQTNIVFSSAQGKNDLSKNKQMIKTKKPQLSTDHSVLN
jgi:hypothetical protein